MPINIPIYVINLPYKPDRRERMTRNLLETGLIASEREIRWVKAVSGDWCWPPAWWKSGNGAWGCLMSHLRVVQEATMDGLESYLVLEDDAVFQPTAVEMLRRLMREAPADWDQIYLGGQHLQAAEPVPGSPFVLRPGNVNRTHAFILRRKAFAKFQQHIMHAPDYIAHPGWHIDHQLGVAHERRDWNVYAPAWWLCGQEAGSSNISGRVNPRMWWHPSTYSKELPLVCIPPNVDAATAERLTRLVHCGNNLIPGSFEDRGLEEAQSTRERLRDWVVMIAREALDMEKLPGVQHPSLTVERLRPYWPAGVHEAETAPLEKWIGYPQNGLFKHPLNEGELGTSERPGMKPQNAA